jgi:hypothetical protein
MSVTNTGLVLSGSAGGLPIPIVDLIGSGYGEPYGTLIHKTNNLSHYINVWVNNISTQEITLNVFKGVNTFFYLDSTINIPPKTFKLLIEPGILLTSDNEYRIQSSSLGLIASGFVYLRNE